MPAVSSDKASAGFTIVETLMVLAIASFLLGLILLAIPALQRSSHNSQRRNEVAGLLSAISRYELNNSGNLPADVTALAGYYTKPAILTVNITTTIGPLGPPQTNATLDNVAVYNYYRCQPGGTASSAGAGYHDVVALYGIETTGGSAPECKQL